MTTKISSERLGGETIKPEWHVLSETLSCGTFLPSLANKTALGSLAHTQDYGEFPQRHHEDPF